LPNFLIINREAKLVTQRKEAIVEVAAVAGKVAGAPPIRGAALGPAKMKGTAANQELQAAAPVGP
jgi:ribosomal protein L11